jgi:hypothetical protein
MPEAQVKEGLTFAGASARGVWSGGSLANSETSVKRQTAVRLGQFPLMGKAALAQCGSNFGRV